ncbi:PREDICTED: uncharacterized protein LOC109580368 [Amphimedon queenslandica]|uniref:FZ domain-containing protein n=1 Tax=Amphimedon queenslandica TaxID=400682 RepID=A0A1X7VH61_AMPQE|nr:PREDICTED: uncharacterized protein LOC109580368 [Amphimedon queenslandica]|eukprot:XP_019848980.1 PREDICTED: uncharacterized protein LOC109580368 [Amphimedon queenslandica]
MMLYSKRECTSLVLACAVVTLTLSSLIVYYYIDEYAFNDEDLSGTINFNVTGTTNTTHCSNESSNATINEPVTLCSLHGLGLIPNGCNSDSCTAYRGSVCAPVLTAWSSCAHGNELRVGSGLDQNSMEYNAVQFNQYLNLASSECQQLAFPFFCLYFFPLCDCTSLQRTVKPTRELCVYIRDSICRAEWHQVGLLRPDLLPDCAQLPLRSQTIENNTTVCNNSEASSGSNFSNTTCEKNFIKDADDFCWASCQNWKQDPESLSLAMKILNTSVSLTGLLMAVIALAFSLYEYKKMFSFPLVYCTFMLLDYLVEVIFVLLSIFWPEVYCSHDQLEISINNPSTFCTISGIVFQYTALQVGLFAVIQLWSMFCALYFAEKTKKYVLNNINHVVFTLIGFVVPGVAIGICYTFDDFKYTQSSFPPLFCTPNKFDYWLYSFVIPYYILLLNGSYLFIFIIWHIQKFQGLFRQTKDIKADLAIPAPNRALLLIPMSALLFGSVLLILSVLTGTQSGSITTAIVQYFICERDGHIPGECSRDNFEHYSHPYILFLAFLIFVLVPGFILNFVVVNWVSTQKGSSSDLKELESTSDDNQQFRNRPISTHSDINKTYEMDAQEILY